MNLYLIGYRCTGKRRVGKDIARKISFVFLDTDEMFVRRYDRTVADFVADNGWGEFQRAEAALFKDILLKNGYVVATGDGVILSSENRGWMQQRGLVIWLQASENVILERMKGDIVGSSLPPDLVDLPSIDEIRATLAQRRPLYEAAADFAVDTDNLDVDDVCRRVFDIITT